MISIIITSYKEPRTIGKSIEAIESQKIGKHETLVVAPDDETLNEAKKFSKKYKSVKIIKDSGRGKPAALNLAVSKAKGDILVLTDGDVYVGDNSIEHLLEQMKDNIGAVSGRPISTNSRKNKYGYWSYVLTEVANDLRIDSIKNNKNFFCSGYLFAIRKELFPKLDEELLSEDGYISNFVYSKGYKMGYAEKAEVYVKYPDNFSDWIKQKKRSAGGYNQIKKKVGVEMRSFKTESFGALRLFKHVSGLKEFLWLVELLFARVYLWILIYRDVNIRKKKQKDIWERVESTK